MACRVDVGESADLDGIVNRITLGSSGEHHDGALQPYLATRENELIGGVSVMNFIVILQLCSAHNQTANRR